MLEATQHPSAAKPEETRPVLSESVSLALTAGLSTGSKLRESQCFTLESNAVDFHAPLSTERWQQGMVALAMFKRGHIFWIADFIQHGRENLPKDVVEKTILDLEFSGFDVDRAMAVADLPRSLRAKCLTPEHCYVLKRSKVPAEKLAWWIKQVEDEKLTASELEASIAAGKVVKAKSSTNTRGIVTVEGFRMQFDSWWRRVDKEEPIATWDDARKREVFNELAPATKLGLKLANELGINLELV